MTVGSNLEGDSDLRTAPQTIIRHESARQERKADQTL
jgi:hypothetical protein